MKIKLKKGYIILMNMFKGKWVYHYYPKDLDSLERIYNEKYSFEMGLKK